MINAYKPKPYISIVLCTHNGSNKMKSSLESLINQDYPKKDYEIIVVDDGSSDSTYEIVKKYGVRVIRHKTNIGIGAARNTGLRAAKGDIYVCFDDDCTADKNWLKNLANVYKCNNAAGAGGKIINRAGKTIFEKYLLRTGYGNPLFVPTANGKNLLERFIQYLKLKLIDYGTDNGNKTVKVFELAGANSSFKTKILREIGGWDTNLRSEEDSDICYRVLQYAKNQYLYATNSSVVYHDHNLTLMKYLSNILNRGPNRRKFYLKHSIIPQVYPFPIIILGLSIIIFIHSYFYGLLFFILLPQILYFWWPLKYMRNFEIEYLQFPYIQFLVELFSTIGMFILSNKALEH